MGCPAVLGLLGTQSAWGAQQSSVCWGHRAHGVPSSLRSAADAIDHVHESPYQPLPVTSRRREPQYRFGQARAHACFLRHLHTTLSRSVQEPAGDGTPAMK
jgi:hypothetical protein